MNIILRIKEVRKTLSLSQEEFGSRLGITGGGVSKIEKGARNVTDQMVLSICREFNVSKIWLIEGHGEMFESDDMEFARAVDRVMFGESDFARRVFKRIVGLFLMFYYNNKLHGAKKQRCGVYIP